MAKQRACGASFCRGCGRGCFGQYKGPPSTGGRYVPERTRLMARWYELQDESEEEHF